MLSFINFIVSKCYRLNAIFIIKTLNENIHNMHYLKNLIVWLILIKKKKLIWLQLLIDLNKIIVVGLFWLNRAGLSPLVLGPNILSTRIETGPTVTQCGLACAQNYASFVCSTLTAGRTASDVLWQADMIIIK